MLIKKSYIFFLISVLFILLSSCKKEPFEACLEDPDCEFFRCKVNGEEWSTNCESDPLFACSAIDVLYGKNIPALDLKANNTLKKQTITLYLRENKVILGKNKLFLNEFLKSRFSDGNKTGNCIIHVIDTTKSGDLFFTNIDTIGFKLEGSFNLECKNECNETIKITDGKFRVKYRF